MPCGAQGHYSSLKHSHHQSSKIYLSRIPPNLPTRDCTPSTCKLVTIPRLRKLRMLQPLAIDLCLQQVLACPFVKIALKEDHRALRRCHIAGPQASSTSNRRRVPAVAQDSSTAAAPTLSAARPPLQNGTRARGTSPSADHSRRSFRLPPVSLSARWTPRICSDLFWYICSCEGICSLYAVVLLVIAISMSFASDSLTSIAMQWTFKMP